MPFVDARSRGTRPGPCTGRRRLWPARSTRLARGTTGGLGTRRRGRRPSTAPGGQARRRRGAERDLAPSRTVSTRRAVQEARPARRAGTCSATRSQPSSRRACDRSSRSCSRAHRARARPRCCRAARPTHRTLRVVTAEEVFEADIPLPNVQLSSWRYAPTTTEVADGLGSARPVPSGRGQSRRTSPRSARPCTTSVRMKCTRQRCQSTDEPRLDGCSSRTRAADVAASRMSRRSGAMTIGPGLVAEAVVTWLCGSKSR